MSESLYDRTVSGFPLSISTALAFESLFPPRQEVYDPERAIPQKINITDYRELWINVDTMFRNMIQSASKAAVTETGHKETTSVLIDEIDTIHSLLQNEGRGTLRPVFYVCDYQQALKNIGNWVELRKEHTANQLLYKNLRDKTMTELRKLGHGVQFMKAGIAASGTTTALIITHIPLDLTYRKQFTKLDLLESNTGRLKKRQQWNTKYFPIPKRDMGILPFYRFLLVTLGDKVMFQPAPSKLRDQIMTTAEKRKWTPMTTQDKCLLDLSIDLHLYDYEKIAAAR